MGETATWADAARRAEAWGELGDWQQAQDTLAPHLQAAAAAGPGEDACRFAYVRGRAWYKRGKRPEADAALEPVERLCAGVDADDLGPKALYLYARVAEVRGHHRSAAARWRALSKAWPDHRYADDGLVHAGIALFKSGDAAAARQAWQDARVEHPDGDMTPEAEHHLVWSLYLDGEPDAAREIATALGKRSVTEDRFHVAAGRYWAARLALYPDVASPTQRRNAGMQEAIAGWSQLVHDQPWSFFAVLAQMRLQELSPDTAAWPPMPAHPDPDAAWSLRTALVDEPAFGRARDLLAAGLVPEALAEWSTLDADALTAPEVAWWTVSRTAVGDDVEAHRALRVWLRGHLPEQPDADGARLLRVAYPDAWFDEVKAATAPYPRVPPRYFQGLVRTESNFDPSAVSWAGARGLSQVMPATGARVGKWLGLSVSKADLLVPKTNLAVGARYLDFLFEDTGGSPFLSAAGYNAGEGRVRQWRGEWGDVPTDEFVERIPFEETHGYVRRVVGTWATYTWLDGGALPDLSAYNHHAHPGDAAP